MGERMLPAGDGNDDPPPLHPSPPLLHPKKPSETYVIQIPRDQVYRVPPPENANIVESYKKPSHETKKICGGCWPPILLAIMLVGFGTFVAFRMLAKPKSPEFSVTHFQKKNLMKGSNHSSGVPEYEIMLHVNNPNQNMKIHYGVGIMALKFKGRDIADGGFPLIQQEAGSRIKVDEILHGTKDILPSWIDRNTNNTSPKALILTIDVPVEIKTWGKDFKKEVIVECDLQVNSLGEGAKIFSEICVTDF